ncbi:MAG TPA: DNA methyltransferase [Candidatus Paceibacterota bacterium]|jgi:site-specific DNA-methyltransferase (adenine-specific)|nr:DNA methyltransferase [Candidatus Paceibacterota bacterium]
MLPQPYFENDGVILYHADCRDILPELFPESFDFVLTDPPYLVSYTGRWDLPQEPIEGDSDPSWVRPIFSEVWRVLKADSLCLSFYGWPHADTFLGTWKSLGFRPVSMISLFKNCWGFGQFTRAQHETAFLLAKGRPRRPSRPISDVLDWEDERQRFHPHQKPLNAISKLIAAYAPPQGLVLDPMCGSGTTLLAARALGKRALGIEIEERYCELAALQLSQRVFPFAEVALQSEQRVIPKETTKERNYE